MNKTNNEIPITSAVLMDTIKDRDQWQARAEAAEKAFNRAQKLVASYDRQDELIGTEFEGVDEVTEVIRLLKQERDELDQLSKAHRERAEAAERACAHLKDCMREAAESVGCSWKWIFRPKLIADVEREDLGKGYVKAEDVKMLMAALRPFTLVNPCLFKTIKPRDTWLWKPSSNTEEIPGINAQHILDAKYALVRASQTPTP